MSTDGDGNDQPSRPRRASIAEIFASRPVIDSSTAQTDASRPHAASMAAAVTQQAQQQSRRLSITTLGLSGSPTNNHPVVPFGSLKRGGAAGAAGAAGRRGSIDMTNESAIEDEEPGPLKSAGSVPGRRLSFGAKAYRDLRSSSGTSAISEASTTANMTAKISPPSASSKTNDGFNWSDNLRARAKRSSISAASPSTSAPAAIPFSAHKRSSSTASSQPSTSPVQIKAPVKAPDHFQERILKGDFYMD